MKKSLLVLALSAAVGSMSANVVEIENTSKYKLVGRIRLKGISCGGEPKKLVIEPKSTARVPSKDCCAGWIVLRVQGKEFKSDVSNTAEAALGILAIEAKLLTGRVSRGPWMGEWGSLLQNITFCGAKEKFKVTVSDKEEKLTIENVTGK